LLYIFDLFDVSAATSAEVNVFMPEDEDPTSQAEKIIASIDMKNADKET